MITNELITTIKKQFQVDWEGIHSINHWARVYSNGIRLSEHTGANIKVVQLFSVFHDSRRYNENRDPQHGHRGAELAVKLRGNYFELSDEEFDLLYQACRLHTNAKTHESITVQTCFDADRLDLGRVGILPKAKYLCTDVAKSEEMILWAHQRSIKGNVPDNILGRFVSH
ncbi:MAG: hypothetical protein KAR01_06900 [Desulfocapsa sp.]|nr:hypothetical protein [Desulfocapsa sp.]